MYIYIYVFMQCSLFSVARLARQPIEWYVTRFIQIFDLMNANAWQDSFIQKCSFIEVLLKALSYLVKWCVTWRIRICGRTLSYLRHNSFVCVPILVYVCGTTHSYLWHDFFTCMPALVYVLSSDGGAFGGSVVPGKAGKHSWKAAHSQIHHTKWA